MVVSQGVVAVRRLLEHHAAAFMAGDLHALADAFVLPCPARDAEGREVLLTSAADVVAPLAALREVCIARGLVGVTARIDSIQLPREGRFRVWFRWEHHYPDRIDVRPPLIYYFRQHLGSRLGIDRAEYLLPDTRLPRSSRR